MKTRNPAANCGNCPYGTPYTGEYGKKLVDCRAQNWEVERNMYPESWCGQHPDFWAADWAADEASDLRERHDRLRAHCDGLAEKVRGLEPPFTMTEARALGMPYRLEYYTEEMYAAWEKGRADVLAIIEGDAS